MAPRARHAATVLWALLALVAYAGLALAAPWSEHFGVFVGLFGLAFLACWGAARRGIGFWPLILGALLFRILLVPLEPALSDDLFRYIWEGRVQQAGFNPYVLPPASPPLEPLRDALWSKINHPDATAIYPPLAQLVFRALATWGDITLFKALFVALDMGVVLVLAAALRSAALPLSRLAWYAWHPLPIVEIAGSGHLEPLALLPFVLAIVWGMQRRSGAWCALSASLAVKYSGAWAAPFLFRARRPSPFTLTLSLLLLLAVTLPFVDAGWSLFASLQLYVAKWRYNDLGFLPLAVLCGSLRAAKLVAVVLVLAAMTGLLRRNTPLPRAVLLLTATILLLSPTVHPWYLLWFLVLLPLAPSTPLFLWSGTVVFAYLFLFPFFGSEAFAPTSLLPRLLQLSPVVLAFLWRRRADKKARHLAARARSSTE